MVILSLQFRGHALVTSSEVQRLLMEVRLKHLLKVLIKRLVKSRLMNYRRANFPNPASINLSWSSWTFQP